MNETKLIAAPIDNKNIVEDFTDDFHFGEFVEYAEGCIRHQAFWCCGALYVISYQFGSNWFSIDFVSGSEGKKNMADKKIAEVIQAYRENYIIKDAPGGTYLIYFKPEE